MIACVGEVAQRLQHRAVGGEEDVALAEAGVVLCPGQAVKLQAVQQEERVPLDELHPGQGPPCPEAACLPSQNT